MVNTKDGALKAKLKNLAKDPDYYRNLAKRKRPNSPGGSFRNTEFARECGRISKRGKQRKENA